MPEGAEQPAARSTGRGRLPDVLVLLTVMLVEGFIIVWVLRRPGAIGAGALEAEAAAAVAITRPSDELMAPCVTIEGFPTSVRVDEAGTRTRTLVIGVALKIGREVGGKTEKSLDLRYLETEYKPKVEQLIPQIKDLLVRETSSRTYGELLDLAVRQQIVESVKRRTNETLKAYGVEPRIVDVYLYQFHFD